MKTVDRFRDEFRFLSNFYPAPFKTEDAREWPTSEHAFQAAKTRSLTDQETIRRMATPGKAKRAGRRIEIRTDWERIKLRTMFRLLTLKFQQNPDLARKLRETTTKHTQHLSLIHI